MRWNGLDPRLVHVSSVVDRGPTRHVLLRSITSFSTANIIPTMIHTHLFLEGQAGGGGEGGREVWEPSKKQFCFGNRGAMERKVLSIFFVLKGQRSNICRVLLRRWDNQSRINWNGTQHAQTCQFTNVSLHHTHSEKIKFSLPMPWGRIGGAEVQLHSLLPSAID